MTLEKNPMHQAHGGTYTGDFLNGKRSEAERIQFGSVNPWEFVQRGMIPKIRVAEMSTCHSARW